MVPPEELKPGMTFYGKKSKLRITIESNGDIIWFKYDSGLRQYLPKDLFYNYFEVIGTSAKTLSEHYGQINPHIKPECKHTNIAKDTYFSSKHVYLTCKDCGKALN